MNPHDRLLHDLRRLGEDAGLVGFGVCTTEPFDDVRAEMDRRIEAGTAGRRRFTYTDTGRATDVGRSFPWARRLVVGSIGYLPEAGSPGPAAPNTGRIARFATADHYRPLRKALSLLAGHLRASGHRAEILVDDGRLVDRAAAVRAGVAWWGRSSMALAPGVGPWMLLGSVVTDALLAPDDPMVRDCGTCVACIPACPTGALDDVGGIDATRCISYWAQTGGLVPLEIRSAWGDRLYGCDDCLEACPPGARLAADAGTRAGRVELLGVLERSDQDLLEEYAHFYLPGRNPDSLRRNALIALGHSGTSDAVRTVAGYLRSARVELRAHAAWTLGRLGGAEAAAALQAAVGGETDQEVVTEIEAALRRVG